MAQEPKVLCTLCWLLTCRSVGILYNTKWRNERKEYEIVRETKGEYIRSVSSDHIELGVHQGPK